MATDSTRHRSRRFLFSSTAGYGHIHPLVPLARALKNAGHEVAFATSPSRGMMLEKAGFTFMPLDGILSADPEYRQIKARLETMPLDLEHELYSYPRIFGGIASRVKAPYLLDIARAWQPDMLIREAGEYSAPIVAEHLGLPHATVAFAAALKGHAIFEREATEWLDPVRQSWGLPSDPDLAALYHYLCLSYSPPTFSMQDVGWPVAGRPIPATTHSIRPEFFDQGDNEKLPDWMESLPDQPTVYVTLGTEVNTEPDLYPRVLQTIIEGLRDAPVNLIVTLGRGKDLADFGPQPANVHIARYIPQTLLLPRCDLMVMHGGSNSLLAAMDVGLPLVVVPLIADQFFNAHITQSSGLGQVVPLANLTPATIRAAMDNVLADAEYRQTARRLQAEMHALPAQERAVALVEQVVETRAPVLNPGGVAFG